jgi:thiol-disulfide isomerase/thioredoxin/sugar lactone lactonase YvrE
MLTQPGTVNAPDFPPDLDWLNTSHPLSIKDLRGKIILLDFWTYCCINCMHILPELKRLERKYKAEVVVIGVHSAKFTGERETENIRQAVLRYEIEHPVVNDHKMQVWQEYAVRAWPTVMLIDPLGKVIGAHSGEGVQKVFDPVIAQMIGHFDQAGQLDRRPQNFALESAPASLLSFPGKVLAGAPGGRLLIADSNHNRIVVASIESGRIRGVIGGGESGLKDGAFDAACFNHPQGMALDGDSLYIADTENHAIRRADLSTRVVSTLAGDGIQSGDDDCAPGQARGRRLNSPWDVTAVHGVLFIAMAGSHQIWGLDLEGGIIAGHAGSGGEDHLDATLLAAALAQPSGLSTDGTVLFIADSEVSSIRTADLDPRGGHVRTVVGQGLFDYGDVDGVGDEVRLQHPLDVEYAGGILYVADTYNNKIKTIDLRTRQTTTFAGTGEAGLIDGAAGQAAFDEPAGLSAAEGKLYVADTNNHAIRVIDLETRIVKTIELHEAANRASGAAERQT